MIMGSGWSMGTGHMCTTSPCGKLFYLHLTASIMNSQWSVGEIGCREALLKLTESPSDRDDARNYRKP